MSWGDYALEEGAVETVETVADHGQLDHYQLQLSSPPQFAHTHVTAGSSLTSS